MASTTKKKRSKKFRVAIEGATSDGRTIERAHIEQMAASYDPNVYGARVWVEHMRSLLPDSPFRAYGDVVALTAQEDEVGGAKKLALYAQIEPTDDLVNMVNVLKQKLYTSIEIAPDFADTGSAYLWGLAVTDSPASLGTEMLAFAAQHPDKNPLASRKQAPGNLFTAAEATQIEFEEEVNDTPRSSVLATLLSSIGLGPKPEAAPRADDPLANLQTFGQQILTQFSEQERESAQLRRDNAENKRQVQQLSADLAALTQRLEKTPATFNQRPQATGPTSGDATDC